MPWAVVLDIRSMKKAFGISTGKHYTNKKAAVEKYGHLLPAHANFKQAHNMIDPFLLVMFYVIHVQKIKGVILS
jgi:hypothetical protein